MTEYVTYSHACLIDEHDGCFDEECRCECHCDDDEATDFYDRSWGY